MIRVLHITPHLGGGVGRALATLIAGAGNVRHDLLCLERPEKMQFVDALRASGCEVHIAPDAAALATLIEAADIVQLEFWNHPAMVRFLCGQGMPAARVVIWCHTSGLHFPTIPDALFDACHRFIFTSGCSLAAERVQALDAGRFAVISSAAGMESLPVVGRTPRTRLRAGYVGSLNFSKLHPDYVGLLSRVSDAGFSVRMVGDETNRALLERQCIEAGRPALLEFAGYSTEVMVELAEMELFIYLLNPTHYGTAEIALLEAMAMGVVPLVLDNPCEREIVEDGVTGFIVRDGEELAERVAWLCSHDDERLAMAERAAASVRSRYTQARLQGDFDTLYGALCQQEKRRFDYRAVFGEGAAAWFRSFVPADMAFRDDGVVVLPEGALRHAMFEAKKGSAFHYAGAFPEDALLQRWQHELERLQ